MRWSNSHHAGAETHVYGLVFYHSRRDRPVNPLELYLLSVFLLRIARVFRMHNHVLISEFCFGPHCSYYKWPVLQIIERIFLSYVFYLVVRYSRLHFRIPVHDSRPAINRTGFVHLFESSADGKITRLIQCVCLATPIYGCAHRTYLAHYPVMAFFGEFFDAFQEFFSP